MNINKFQKKMFDRLIAGERVVYSETPEGQVILTNNYEAYIFFKNEIYLNLDMCQKVEDLSKIAEPNEKDRKVELSNKIYNSGGRICYELVSEDGMSVWVQEKFLKPFDDCCTFKAYSPENRILVSDPYGRLIAVVLPIRISMEESHEKESN